MIDHRKKSRLRELLAAHGAVSSLSEIPGNNGTGSCIILATMKSPQDATRVHLHFGFQPFGYSALIIGAQWLSTNLED